MTLRRADLEQFFGSNPRLLREFEDQAQAVKNATTNVADTQALKDATVIVLSANGDFTNERVLQIGEGIDIDITADTVTLSVKDVARTQDHQATFVPPADVLLFLPPDGVLISTTTPLSQYPSFGDYANDAAAAAGGVPVGFPYHTTGAMKVRLA
jgi:hypothetical protein